MSSPNATQEIETAVIAGTGLMARGLAAAFAAAGFDVLVVGRSLQKADDTAADARALVSEAFFRGTREGRIDAGVLGEVSLDGASIAVETVLEDVAAKHAVLRLLDRDLPADAIIGSNTASLSLETLAEPLSRPGRFAGWHFMNPSHLTALAEVIPGPQTDTSTIERLREATRALGKTPITMRFELPGFVWNRLIFAMWRECEHIVATGAADRESVDAAVSDGLAPRWTAGGPFVTMDLGGLDDFARAAEQVLPALSSMTEIPASLWQAVADDDSLYAWTPEQRRSVESLRRTALASGVSLTEKRREINLKQK